MRKSQSREFYKANVSHFFPNKIWVFVIPFHPIATANRSTNVKESDVDFASSCTRQLRSLGLNLSQQRLTTQLIPQRTQLPFTFLFQSNTRSPWSYQHPKWNLSWFWQSICFKRHTLQRLMPLGGPQSIRKHTLQPSVTSRELPILLQIKVTRMAFPPLEPSHSYPHELNTHAAHTCAHCSNKSWRRI